MVPYMLANGSLEATHQGVKTGSQLLAANPELLNCTDAQGNTPLHYAVAEHNLALIEYRIQQGAQITAKNLLGETAADWFHEYVTSTYMSNPSQLAKLRQQIVDNNVEFVTDSLKAGISRFLRFDRGETLLHYAVEAQQITIIELLLEGISHEAIDRLLNLKDCGGVTPLALAQERAQTGSRIAQEIVNSLRGKLHAAAAEKPAAALQTPPPRSLLAPISLERQELKALADSFTHSLTSVDFGSLNPLRSTIVKLAYQICCQAHHYHLKTFPPTVSSREQHPLLNTLLKKLFGVWDDNTQLKFVKKLESIIDYLAYLIQQRQADQVIHFSDEESYAEGWSHPHENKIFLNPTIIADVVALLTTFIHEVTHQVNHSYDFFPPYYSHKKENSYFFLEKAYELASTGAAESLKQEKRKLFEIRQLLEEGFSDCWEKNLNKWMALNSAETLAEAILASATMPAGCAKLIGSKQQPILWILLEAFLSAYVGEITFDSPEAKSTKKRSNVNKWRSLASISTSTGSDGERSPDREVVSSSKLTEKVSAFVDPVSAVTTNLLQSAGITTPASVSPDLTAAKPNF